VPGRRFARLVTEQDIGAYGGVARRGHARVIGGGSSLLQSGVRGDHLARFFLAASCVLKDRPWAQGALS
jgi:hypothetical protein